MARQFLALPSVKFQRSFLRAAEEYREEFQKTGNERIKRYADLDLEKLRDPGEFGKFTEKLIAQAKGEGLPEGFVWDSVFWLADGDEFIGRADIRHRLTPLLRETGGHIGYDIRPSKRKQGYGKLILKLALDKAKELGIKDVLVTCDATNIGSKKVIETNGGKFESQVKGESGKPDKLRYWIITKENFS